MILYFLSAIPWWVSLPQLFKNAWNKRSSSDIYLLATFICMSLTFITVNVNSFLDWQGLSKSVLSQSLLKLFDGLNCAGVFFLFSFTLTLIVALKNWQKFIFAHLSVTLVIILLGESSFSANGVIKRNTPLTIAIISFWFLYLPLITYNFWTYSFWVKDKLMKNKLRLFALAVALLIFAAPIGLVNIPSFRYLSQLFAFLAGLVFLVIIVLQSIFTKTEPLEIEKH